ncbi:MAG: carbon-nitrogen hydrolase family protein [Rhodobacteraceae bacterium]|nr:carbon-nitrogen hydrolase family protein [Paracoccaceae bacterium]
MSRFRIACLQTIPQPDFASANAEAGELLRAAVDAGAEFIALPEYCGGLVSDGPRISPPAAPEHQHPVLAMLRDFARQHGVWLLVGSIAVSGPGGRILNRGYVVDAGGSIRARYDKIHMFDIQLSERQVYRESATVCPGDAAVTVETLFGCLGMTICYDLRFPALYRALAQAGAQILVVPAAFTKATGEAHWHILNRARAIENGCFVISPCATGPVPGGGHCYGHSLIVDAWGHPLADGGEDRGYITADIDLEAVSRARSRIPSLSHDRPFELVVSARVAA